MMQIARCIREAARQTAKTQSRVLEVSRRDASLRDYLPDADIVRHVTHEQRELPLFDALTFPFGDGEFDACLVTDAYEHIPAEWRPRLVKEMLRVTKGIVLIGAPQKDPIVDRFDRIVFDFIWGKYAERFTPLEQHLTFGTDSLEQVLENVRAAGADGAVALPCNYVYRWIHQILIYFDLQHRHPDFDLFEPLNRIYNERMAPYDYREPCYRYLVVVATHNALNVESLMQNLQSPPETPETVAAIDGVLAQTFKTIDSTASERLKEKDQQIAMLHAAIQQLQENNTAATLEIERLLSIIKELQNGNEWALNEISLLRKARA